MSEFRKISIKNALAVIQEDGVKLRPDLRYNNADTATEYYELPSGEILVLMRFLSRVPIYPNADAILKMWSSAKGEPQHILANAPRTEADFMKAQENSLNTASTIIKSPLTQDISDLRKIDSWISTTQNREDREKAFIPLCLYAHYLVSRNPVAEQFFKFDSKSGIDEPYFNIKGRAKPVQIFTILWDEFFENFKNPSVHSLITMYLMPG